MPSPSIHGIRSDPQGPHKGVTRGARGCTQYPCHIGTFSSTRMLSGAVGRGSDVRAPPTEWLTVIQTPVYGLCNAPGGRWWVLAEVSAIRHTKRLFCMRVGVRGLASTWTRACTRTCSRVASIFDETKKRQNQGTFVQYDWLCSFSKIKGTLCTCVVPQPHP